jgi:hypothetical protein
MGKQEQRFHIGDVLSIVADRLVSRDGFHGLERALDYMADEHIFTHQIPRVMLEARAAIVAVYPSLAEVVVPDDIDESTVHDWLHEQARRYGEFLRLPRMSVDQHERIDPYSEAIEKKHASQIRTVRAS